MALLLRPSDACLHLIAIQLTSMGRVGVWGQVLLHAQKHLLAGMMADTYLGSLQLRTALQMAPFQQANAQSCNRKSVQCCDFFHAIFQKSQGAGPVVICWASEEAATVVHVSAVLRCWASATSSSECHATRIKQTTSYPKVYICRHCYRFVHVSAGTCRRPSAGVA